MTDGAANNIEEIGVGVGDTVGVFMPMSAEAVAAMFACAKLGAIFIPIFSGYAADAVATRLNDADAKVLEPGGHGVDRKSTRLNSSHQIISYAVFCLKKKKKYK